MKGRGTCPSDPGQGIFSPEKLAYHYRRTSMVVSMEYGVRSIVTGIRLVERLRISLWSNDPRPRPMGDGHKRKHFQNLITVRRHFYSFAANGAGGHGEDFMMMIMMMRQWREAQVVFDSLFLSRVYDSVFPPFYLFVGFSPSSIVNVIRCLNASCVVLPCRKLSY